MNGLDDFCKAYIRAIEAREALPSRAAAEAAWYPGHPLGSVEAIEARIIARRTEDALLVEQHAGPAAA